MIALRDLEILTAAMEGIGFHLTRSEPGTMDSGVAEFSDGKRTITIGKDKSIWEFSGPRSHLEPLGLWRGFADTNEFRNALVSYVKQTVA